MITASLKFDCCGCSKSVTIENIYMQARIESAFGGQLLSVTIKPKLDPEDYTPDGWVAFDPYTKVTYCTDCWNHIMDNDYE